MNASVGTGGTDSSAPSDIERETTSGKQATRATLDGLGMRVAAAHGERTPADEWQSREEQANLRTSWPPSCF